MSYTTAQYQIFFIGVKKFIHSPVFRRSKSALNWISKNRHRVVEDLQIIKVDPCSQIPEFRKLWYHVTDDNEIGADLRHGFQAPFKSN
jgi:hypothetical protein